MMGQFFFWLTSLENTFANTFIVGIVSRKKHRDKARHASWLSSAWRNPLGSSHPFSAPTPISPEQVQAMLRSLTLCPCRSSGSPPLPTRPQSVQECHTPPSRNTSSGSARSQKPPPAWCRAAPPPGTSRWKLPGRRSAGEQQRQHRQSAQRIEKSKGRNLWLIS